MGSFFLSRPKNRQKPARPASPRARRPHPGRNLGLDRQSRVGALARLGRGRPDHLQPFDLIDGSPACFGRSKAAVAGFLRNPSSFSSPLSFSSFSLYRRSFLSAAQDREDSKRERARRARRWSVHGAVAGPLAGTRAPQRVSTPPSSGLAAAPPWPSPESQLPGSASSPAPAKGHLTRGEVDFLPFLFEFIRMGK